MIHIFKLPYFLAQKILICPHGWTYDCVHAWSIKSFKIQWLRWWWLTAAPKYCVSHRINDAHKLNKMSRVFILKRRRDSFPPRSPSQPDTEASLGRLPACFEHEFIILSGKGLETSAKRWPSLTPYFQTFQWLEFDIRILPKGEEINISHLA